jgi:hypothetical protein
MLPSSYRFQEQFNRRKQKIESQDGAANAQDSIQRSAPRMNSMWES